MSVVPVISWSPLGHPKRSSQEPQTPTSIEIYGFKRLDFMDVLDFFGVEKPDSFHLFVLL